MDSAQTRSGKGHRDENFPVASHLIAPRHRPVILAFYRFARAADDAVDHASLSSADKLRLLDGLESTLLGRSDREAVAAQLRDMLQNQRLDPRHALDLLTAFRRDVSQLRYETWDDLIDYCRFSAMPVGRFVLDVHGESHALWPASDALCAALQIINHLQDCAKDFQSMNRVYLPLDALRREGLEPSVLGSTAAPPALLRVFNVLAQENARLLQKSAGFAGAIGDFRLSLEVAVIQRLAERLNLWLQRRDPLSGKVHLGKAQMLGITLAAAAGRSLGRLMRAPVLPRQAGEQI